MLPFRTPLAELEDLALRDEAGRLVVESRQLIDAQVVALAPLAFGDTDFNDRRIVEHPFEGAWKHTSYRTAEVRLYRLRNAFVHSSAGVVLVGDRLVKEALEHVHPPDHGMEIDPATGVTTLRSTGMVRLAGRAVHALAAGAFNYYHWMIEAVCRLTPLPDEHFADILLVPPLDAGFQKEALSSLGRELRVYSVDTARTVQVDELMMIPSFTCYGYAPPPEMLGMADRLLASVQSCAPHRRIYIHRLGAKKRRLSNEVEIAAMMARAGYDVVDLDGMSLAEQMRLFAEATHIVAPHGAGLTNLIFCRPGTAVCELQMDCYVNWLFRRLANLRGLRYGCVVGSIEGEWEAEWPHNRTWGMPIERLAAVLESSGFFAPA